MPQMGRGSLKSTPGYQYTHLLQEHLRHGEILVPIGSYVLWGEMALRVECVVFIECELTGVEEATAQPIVVQGI